MKEKWHPLPGIDFDLGGYDEAATAANAAQKRIAELEAQLDSARTCTHILSDALQRHRELLQAETWETNPDAIKRLQSELATLRAQLRDLSDIETAINSLSPPNFKGQGEVVTLPEKVSWLVDHYRKLSARAEASRILLTVAGMGADGKPDTLTEMVQEAIIQIDALQSQAERNAAIARAAQKLISTHVKVNGRPQVDMRAFNALNATVRAPGRGGKGE